MYDEIVPLDKKAVKDEMATLISKYKVNFRPISKVQAQLVAQIVSLFPNLIDPNSKRNEADPWIVAMAIEATQQVTLFGQDTLVVVSTESEKSSTKIPAVCKHFKIKHMNLFEFFEDNSWQFSLSKG